MDLALRRIDWENWTVTLVLLPACAYFLLVDWNAGGLLGTPWMLMHSLLLIPHEAGHFFFRFFGEWMMFAGGTILQLALPAIIAWSALTWGSRAGFQLGAFATGVSFLDVAPYAADAQARQLPLLGGLSDTYHDWYNLLSPLGMLDHAEAVGTAFVIGGLLVWAVALSAPKWTA
ncbi:MAG: hypothetical protein AAF791_14330 [Bacteroidota bacterium]